MKKLYELLHTAEGSDAIRRCWGDVPEFRYGEILHMKRAEPEGQEQRLVLTGVFLTHGPEDANECKPSKLVIEFSGVCYWEYDSAFAQRNGIELDGILRSPPPGTIAVNVDHTFYLVCRSIRVVSCVHEPFSDGPDEVRAAQ